MYPLPNKMTQVLVEADTLVVEVNLLALDPQKVKSIVEAQAIYPDNAKGLEADLKPETIDLLKAYLKTTGGDLDALGSMRPWYLSINLGLSELARRGYDAELGIDFHFLKTARSTGMDIIQLETFEEQIRLLADDPVAVQDLALRAMLEDMRGLDQYLDQLITAWKAGDAHQMYDLSMQVNQRYPQLIAQSERLVDQRNLRMAAAIEELLKAPGDLLILVGALHMGGDQGLLKLLGRNHRIRQVYH